MKKDEFTRQIYKSPAVVFQKNNLTWLIFEGVAGDVSVTDMRRIPFQG